MGAVRAIVIIPAGQAGFATGGFATGCADKVIRLYSFDADSHKYELVRSLVGHSQSVLDLSWSVDGDLLSGSWDGTARCDTSPLNLSLRP
jgi:WD40 repeat protein